MVEQSHCSRRGGRMSRKTARGGPTVLLCDWEGAISASLAERRRKSAAWLEQRTGRRRADCGPAAGMAQSVGLADKLRSASTYAGVYV